MNVIISKSVEQSLKKLPSEEREEFVNSTLLVALTNKEIAQERKTSAHQSILTEAKEKAAQNNHSHAENVDRLENILSEANGS